MSRHRVDVFSLVAGLLFVVLAIGYVVGAYTDLHVDAKVALPLILVGLGVAGLLSAVFAQRRSDQRAVPAPDHDYEPPAE